MSYLAVGAAIGPSGFRWSRSASGKFAHFAGFGVAVMLFPVGLEFRLRMLGKTRQQLLGFNERTEGMVWKFRESRVRDFVP